MSNRFTSRLSDNDDFKRDELIRKIEHAVEHMTLSELEALSYDMFTKGYITDCSFASFTPHALFYPTRPERAEALSPGQRPGLSCSQT